MDCEADAWWTVRYPTYSIKSLEKHPLYEALKGHEQSWEESTKECSMRGVIDTAEKSVERKEGSKVETLSFSKDTWTLAITEVKPSHEVTTTSSVHSADEWGSITKKFPTHVQEETWSVRSEERVYSRTSTESGVRKGFRVGITAVKGTVARWVEEICNGFRA